MDLLFQASQSINSSSALERKVNDLSDKLDQILVLLKQQSQQSVKATKVKEVKQHKRVLTRSQINEGTSTITSKGTVTSKGKEFYSRYPKIFAKYWGKGRGRRPLSVIETMDKLIAELSSE